MRKRVRILLVEDDPIQAAWIRMNLVQVYTSEPEWIDTESEFQLNLGKIVSYPPDVVIMDVMLSWAEASESIPPRPDDVRQEGMYRAGLRCQDLLSKSSETSTVPVILYTVQNLKDLGSELEDMPANVLYLPKEADIGPLVEQIDKLVQYSSG